MFSPLGTYSLRSVSRGIPMLAQPLSVTDYCCIFVPDMENKNRTPKFYPFVGTASTALVILVATLMPSDRTIQLDVDGLDTVFHFIMFGALAMCAMFDTMLWRKWAPGLFVKLMVALAVTLYGGAIELLQDYMGFGRGAEWSDFIADAAGAFLAIIPFSIVGRRYNEARERDRANGEAR